MLSKILIILLIPFSICLAQLSSTELSGYVKYLFSSTSYPGYSEKFSDHLLHSRLNSRWYATENLTFAAEFRMRAFFGETIENIPNYSDEIKKNTNLLDLDFAVWNSQNSFGYLEVDRLWADWVKDSWQLTLGRQRIAWGTNWVWNPTDLFNPRSVLNFDYEELPGSDAFRIQYYTGPVSKIDFVINPRNRKEDLTFAGLVSFNEWDYDFNIIAGYRKEKWLVGGGWVGDIFGAGFRGEILVSESPQKDFYQPEYELFNLKALSEKKNPVSTALSIDYTFPNSFYIHTEFLYNSNGAKELTALYRSESIELDLLSPARFSLFQEFAYDITPLIRASLFIIYNPDDQSYVIVPSLNMSVITNLDAYVTGLLFNGNKLTEFGDYGESIYFRVKYAF